MNSLGKISTHIIPTNLVECRNNAQLDCTPVTPEILNNYYPPILPQMDPNTAVTLGLTTFSLLAYGMTKAASVAKEHGYTDLANCAKFTAANATFAFMIIVGAVAYKSAL